MRRRIKYTSHSSRSIFYEEIREDYFYMKYVRRYCSLRDWKYFFATLVALFEYQTVSKFLFV